MTDTIVLAMPADARFRSVASLVLGGIGSRFDLSYERVDDLQLAVLSVVEAGADGRITLEMQGEKEGVSVSLGPLLPGIGSDRALGRVLAPLVDEVEREDRDGAEWLTLRLRRAPHA
jgi:hypothetical protein